MAGRTMAPRVEIKQERIEEGRALLEKATATLNEFREQGHLPGPPYNKPGPRYVELYSAFGVAQDEWRRWLFENCTELLDAASRLAELGVLPLELGQENAELRQGRDEAVGIISRYGGIDGAHHKQWVLDQAVRALVGDAYPAWVVAQKAGEDGPATYDWDEGIPP